MVFSVTVLGSSSALPTSNRYLTAHVLNVHERFFLIDCGEGTQFQLRKYKAKFSQLNHIFITHLHGDHIFGLPGLISSFNLLGRKHDLHIYAHTSLETILKQFLSNFFTDLNFKIIYHALNHDSNQIIFDNALLTVESFPLKHRIPTCGFIFREKLGLKNIRKDMLEFHKIPVSEILSIKKGNDFIKPDGAVVPNSHLTLDREPGKSYAFCSDTAYLEDVVPYIKDVDLLYHEATFSDQDSERAKETFHSTASQAANIAKLSNAKQLIIGHFSARYKDVTLLVDQARKIFPNTTAAVEGMQITP